MLTYAIITSVTFAILFAMLLLLYTNSKTRLIVMNSILENLYIYIAKLNADITHWKAKHDNQVDIARILLDSTDMPIERVEAYKHMQVLIIKNEELININSNLVKLINKDNKL
jgi:hypothetical protein